MKSFACLRLVVVAFLAMGDSAFAEPSIGLEGKGGLNASTLDYENRENRYGFSGGLAAVYQHAVAASVLLGGQVDVLYTPRGAKAVVDGDEIGRTRAHYLDFTLAVRPEKRFGALGVYAIVGGGIDILLSAKKQGFNSDEQDITDALRGYDIELLVGAGATWHLPFSATTSIRASSVFLEARYDLGLLDTDPITGSFKNRNAAVMLGVVVALGSDGAGSAAPLTTSARQ